MKRSDIDPMPAFFDRYINLVEDVELLEGLSTYAPAQVFADTDALTALDEKIYAPGKWTVKDILQHCIDNERIMTYRALRFARHDQTPLPGYEEDFLAAHARANRRTVADLLSEFTEVRTATLSLFRSFDDAMLRQSGQSFKGSISVLALGFVLVGHPLHHRNIIRERYYPLLA
ncbi:DinB family protein [Rhabdobacter roseus]|uniref:DinB-like domain-containing protein n=1 Tax=Rhabdobacter roseus TaxID=1655419 RepID=A0A840TXA2_9BACT|nr:DinB family protein [Rhabdobacter roseus]MBB5286242.1 hypothetical protein [Rhabdobacter roseus]